MTPNHRADKMLNSDEIDKVSFSMDHVRLDSLEIFASIARCGGFRAAALERGVSSSALSQTINSLEAALGIRLLNRTTRSISPTEAGERLLQRLGPALAEIRIAIDDLNQLKESPSGTLRINAPAPAVDHYLCPLAFEFMQLHPDVKVEIVSDAAVVDIVEQGFDAGVRFGRQLEQDMIAIPLGPSLRYSIVASPDYLEARGTPVSPTELIRHECIRRRFPGGALVTWKFEKDDETVDFIPDGRLTLSSAYNELQAALAGHGIAHVLERYSLPLISEGKLIELMNDWTPRLPSWFLYYTSKRHSSAAMKAFTDYIRAYDWSGLPTVHTGRDTTQIN